MAAPIYIRLLFRLKLLRYFNFLVESNFNRKKFLIPVKESEGLSNLYMETDYDFSVYHHFKEQIDNGTFVDIGANLGQTIIKVASISQSPIISFEPNANCLAYLEALKDANTLSHVQIVPAAIADSTGLLKLFLRHKTDTASSLVPTFGENTFHEDKFIWVNAISSEEILKLVTNKVSFIKVDVEGAEHMVLPSLKAIIQRDSPVIYCEVLDSDGPEKLVHNDKHKAIVASIVKDLGYSIFQYDKQSGSLKNLSSFPSRVFSFKTFDLCNYIFMKNV